MAQDDDPALAFDAFRDEVLSPERISRTVASRKAKSGRRRCRPIRANGLTFVHDHSP
jgi:hypothetical protein